MADFLVTEGISHHLQQMIGSTEERLILISPYLKINERIKQSLEDLDRLKINVRLVFRENKLSPSEQMWLEPLLSIQTYCYEHLHAKCYLNENEAIVTSMNLYESSQVHNLEMGMRVSRLDEPELYGKIYDEAMKLVRMSKQLRMSVSEIPKSSQEDGAKTDVKHDKPTRCPRCGGELVERVSSRGDKKGVPFLGCSTYPKCRYIKEL